MPLTQDQLHVFLRALLDPTLTAPQLAALFDLNLQDYAKLVNSPQIQNALNELTKAIESRNRLLAAASLPRAIQATTATLDSYLAFARLFPIESNPRSMIEHRRFASSTRKATWLLSRLAHPPPCPPPPRADVPRPPRTPDCPSLGEGDGGRALLSPGPSPRTPRSPTEPAGEDRPLQPAAARQAPQPRHVQHNKHAASTRRNTRQAPERVSNPEFPANDIAPAPPSERSDPEGARTGSESAESQSRCMASHPARPP
jgi:hypothetical protein